MSILIQIVKSNKIKDKRMTVELNDAAYTKLTTKDSRVVKKRDS